MNDDADVGVPVSLPLAAQTGAGGGEEEEEEEDYRGLFDGLVLPPFHASAQGLLSCHTLSATRLKQHHIHGVSVIEEVAQGGYGTVRSGYIWGIPRVHGEVPAMPTLESVHPTSVIIKSMHSHAKRDLFRFLKGTRAAGHRRPPSWQEPGTGAPAVATAAAPGEGEKQTLPSGPEHAAPQEDKAPLNHPNDSFTSTSSTFTLQVEEEDIVARPQLFSYSASWAFLLPHVVAEVHAAGAMPRCPLINVPRAVFVGHTAHLVLDACCPFTTQTACTKPGKYAVRDRQGLRADYLMVWTFQLFAALAHAHAYGIVHRDIKPDNVFISAEHAAVLGDWGLSTALPHDWQAGARSTAYALAYRAPEVSLLGRATYASDVFAAGMTALTWASGEGTNPIYSKHKKKSDTKYYAEGTEGYRLWILLGMLGYPIETWTDLDVLAQRRFPPLWEGLDKTAWDSADGARGRRHRAARLRSLLGRQDVPDMWFELIAAALHPTPDRRPAAADIAMHSTFLHALKMDKAPPPPPSSLLHERVQMSLEFTKYLAGNHTAVLRLFPPPREFPFCDLTLTEPALIAAQGSWPSTSKITESLQSILQDAQMDDATAFAGMQWLCRAAAQLCLHAGVILDAVQLTTTAFLAHLEAAGHGGSPSQQVHLARQMMQNPTYLLHHLAASLQLVCATRHCGIIHSQELAAIPETVFDIQLKEDSIMQAMWLQWRTLGGVAVPPTRHSWFFLLQSCTTRILEELGQTSAVHSELWNLMCSVLTVEGARCALLHDAPRVLEEMSLWIVTGALPRDALLLPTVEILRDRAKLPAWRGE